jgi:chromosome segregation ATPase
MSNIKIGVQLDFQSAAGIDQAEQKIKDFVTSIDTELQKINIPLNVNTAPLVSALGEVETKINNLVQTLQTKLNQIQKDITLNIKSGKIDMGESGEFGISDFLKLFDEKTLRINVALAKDLTPELAEILDIVKARELSAKVTLDFETGQDFKGKFQEMLEAGFREALDKVRSEIDQARNALELTGKGKQKPNMVAVVANTDEFKAKIAAELKDMVFHAKLLPDLTAITAMLAAESPKFRIEVQVVQNKDFNDLLSFFTKDKRVIGLTVNAPKFEDVQTKLNEFTPVINAGIAIDSNAVQQLSQSLAGVANLDLSKIFGGEDVLSGAFENLEDEMIRIARIFADEINRALGFESDNASKTVQRSSKSKKTESPEIAVVVQELQSAREELAKIGSSFSADLNVKDDFDTRIGSIKKTIDAGKSALDQKRNDLLSIKAQIDEITKRFSGGSEVDYEKEIRSLESAIATNKLMIEENSRLANLRGEPEPEKIKKLNANRDLQKENRQLYGQINELKKAQAEISNGELSSDPGLKLAKEQLQSAQKEISQTEQQIAGLQDELKALETAQKTAADSANAFNQRQKEAQERVERLTKSLEELRAVALAAEAAQTKQAGSTKKTSANSNLSGLAKSISDSFANSPIKLSVVAEIQNLQAIKETLEAIKPNLTAAISIDPQSVSKLSESTQILSGLDLSSIFGEQSVIDTALSGFEAGMRNIAQIFASDIRSALNFLQSDDAESLVNAQSDKQSLEEIKKLYDEINEKISKSRDEQLKLEKQISFIDFKKEKNIEDSALYQRAAEAQEGKPDIHGGTESYYRDRIEQIKDDLEYYKEEMQKALTSAGNAFSEEDVRKITEKIVSLEGDLSEKQYRLSQIGNKGELNRLQMELGELIAEALDATRRLESVNQELKELNEQAGKLDKSLNTGSSDVEPKQKQFKINKSLSNPLFDFSNIETAISNAIGEKKFTISLIAEIENLQALKETLEAIRPNLTAGISIDPESVSKLSESTQILSGLDLSSIFGEQSVIDTALTGFENGMRRIAGIFASEIGTSLGSVVNAAEGSVPQAVETKQKAAASKAKTPEKVASEIQNIEQGLKTTVAAVEAGLKTAAASNKSAQASKTSAANSLKSSNAATKAAIAAAEASDAVISLVKAIIDPGSASPRPKNTRGKSNAAPATEPKISSKKIEDATERLAPQSGQAVSISLDPVVAKLDAVETAIKSVKTSIDAIGGSFENVSKTSKEATAKVDIGLNDHSIASFVGAVQNLAGMDNASVFDAFSNFDFTGIIWNEDAMTKALASFETKMKAVAKSFATEVKTSLVKEAAPIAASAMPEVAATDEKAARKRSRKKESQTETGEDSQLLLNRLEKALDEASQTKIASDKQLAKAVGAVESKVKEIEAVKNNLSSSEDEIVKLQQSLSSLESSKQSIKTAVKSTAPVKVSVVNIEKLNQERQNLLDAKTDKEEEVEEISDLLEFQLRQAAKAVNLKEADRKILEKNQSEKDLLSDLISQISKFLANTDVKGNKGSEQQSEKSLIDSGKKLFEELYGVSDEMKKIFLGLEKRAAEMKLFFDAETFRNGGTDENYLSEEKFLKYIFSEVSKSVSKAGLDEDVYAKYRGQGDSMPSELLTSEVRSSLAPFIKKTNDYLEKQARAAGRDPDEIRRIAGVEKPVGRDARSKDTQDLKNVLRLLSSALDERNIVESRISWESGAGITLTDPTKQTEARLQREKDNLKIINQKISEIDRKISSQPSELEVSKTNKPQGKAPQQDLAKTNEILIAKAQSDLESARVAFASHQNILQELDRDLISLQNAVEVAAKQKADSEISIESASSALKSAAVNLSKEIVKSEVKIQDKVEVQVEPPTKKLDENSQQTAVNFLANIDITLKSIHQILSGNKNKSETLDGATEISASSVSINVPEINLDNILKPFVNASQSVNAMNDAIVSLTNRFEVLGRTLASMSSFDMSAFSSSGQDKMEEVAANTERSAQAVEEAAEVIEKSVRASEKGPTKRQLESAQRAVTTQEVKIPGLEAKIKDLRLELEGLSNNFTGRPSEEVQKEIRGLNEWRGFSTLSEKEEEEISRRIKELSAEYTESLGSEKKISRVRANLTNAEADLAKALERRAEASEKLADIESKRAGSNTARQEISQIVGSLEDVRKIAATIKGQITRLNNRAKKIENEQGSLFTSLVGRDSGESGNIQERILKQVSIAPASIGELARAVSSGADSSTEGQIKEALRDQNLAGKLKQAEGSGRFTLSDDFLKEVEKYKGVQKKIAEREGELEAVEKNLSDSRQVINEVVIDSKNSVENLEQASEHIIKAAKKFPEIAGMLDNSFFRTVFNSMFENSLRSEKKFVRENPIDASVKNLKGRFPQYVGQTNLSGRDIKAEMAAAKAGAKTVARASTAVEGSEDPCACIKEAMSSLESVFVSQISLLRETLVFISKLERAQLADVMSNANAAKNYVAIQKAVAAEVKTEASRTPEKTSQSDGINEGLLKELQNIDQSAKRAEKARSEIQRGSSALNPEMQRAPVLRIAEEETLEDRLKNVNKFLLKSEDFLEATMTNRDRVLSTLLSNLESRERKLSEALSVNFTAPGTEVASMLGVDTVKSLQGVISPFLGAARTLQAGLEESEKEKNMLEVQLATLLRDMSRTQDEGTLQELAKKEGELTDKIEKLTLVNEKVRSELRRAADFADIANSALVSAKNQTSLFQRSTQLQIGATENDPRRQNLVKQIYDVLSDLESSTDVNALDIKTEGEVQSIASEKRRVDKLIARAESEIKRKERELAEAEELARQSRSVDEGGVIEGVLSDDLKNSFLENIEALKSLSKILVMRRDQLESDKSTFQSLNMVRRAQFRFAQEPIRQSEAAKRGSVKAVIDTDSALSRFDELSKKLDIDNLTEAASLSADQANSVKKVLTGLESAAKILDVRIAKRTVTSDQQVEFFEKQRQKALEGKGGMFRQDFGSTPEQAENAKAMINKLADDMIAAERATTVRDVAALIEKRQKIAEALNSKTVRVFRDSTQSFKRFEDTYRKLNDTGLKAATLTKTASAILRNFADGKAGSSDFAKFFRDFTSLKNELQSLQSQSKVFEEQGRDVTELNNRIEIANGALADMSSQYALLQRAKEAFEDQSKLEKTFDSVVDNVTKAKNIINTFSLGEDVGQEGERQLKAIQKALGGDLESLNLSLKQIQTSQQEITEEYNKAGAAAFALQRLGSEISEDQKKELQLLNDKENALFAILGILEKQEADAKKNLEAYSVESQEIQNQLKLIEKRNQLLKEAQSISDKMATAGEEATMLSSVGIRGAKSLQGEEDPVGAMFSQAELLKNSDKEYQKLLKTIEKIRKEINQLESQGFDTTELTNNLRSLEGQAKNISASLGKVGKALDMAIQAEEFATKLNSFERSLQNMGDQADESSEDVRDLAAMFKELEKSSSSLDKNIAKLELQYRSFSDKNDEAAKAIRETIDRMREIRDQTRSQLFGPEFLNVQKLIAVSQDLKDLEDSISALQLAAARQDMDKGRAYQQMNSTAPEDRIQGVDTMKRVGADARNNVDKINEYIFQIKQLESITGNLTEEQKKQIQVLEQLRSTFEQNSAEVKRAGWQMKMVEKSAISAGQAFEMYTQQIADSARQAFDFVHAVTIVASVMQGLRSSFSELVNSAKAFARTMTVMQSTSMTMEQIYKKLTQTVTDTAIAYGKSVEEVSEVLKQFGSAGLTAEEAFSALDSTMKTLIATQADGEQIARAISGIYSIYGDQLSKTGGDMAAFAEINDVLTSVYQNHQVELDEMVQGLKFAASSGKLAGFSFQETSAFLAILNDNMLKSGMAGRSLNAVFAQIAAKSGDIEKTFGFKFDKDKTIQEQFVPFLEDVRRKIGEGIVKPSDLDKQFKFFDRQGAKGFQTLVMNIDKVKEAIVELNEKAGGLSSELSSIVRNDFATQFERMKQALLAIGKDFVEPIKGAITILGDIAVGIREFMKIDPLYLATIAKWIGVIIFVAVVLSTTVVSVVLILSTFITKLMEVLGATVISSKSLWALTKSFFGVGAASQTAAATIRTSSMLISTSLGVVGAILLVVGATMAYFSDSTAKVSKDMAQLTGEIKQLDREIDSLNKFEKKINAIAYAADANAYSHEIMGQRIKNAYDQAGDKVTSYGVIVGKTNAQIGADIKNIVDRTKEQIAVVREAQRVQMEGKKAEQREKIITGVAKAASESGVLTSQVEILQPFERDKAAQEEVEKKFVKSTKDFNEKLSTIIGEALSSNAIKYEEIIELINEETAKLQKGSIERENLRSGMMAGALAPDLKSLTEQQDLIKILEAYREKITELNTALKDTESIEIFDATTKSLIETLEAMETPGTELGLISNAANEAQRLNKILTETDDNIKRILALNNMSISLADRPVVSANVALDKDVVLSQTREVFATIPEALKEDQKLRDSLRDAFPEVEIDWYSANLDEISEALSNQVLIIGDAGVGYNNVNVSLDKATKLTKVLTDLTGETVEGGKTLNEVYLTNLQMQTRINNAIKLRAELLKTELDAIDQTARVSVEFNELGREELEFQIDKNVLGKLFEEANYLIAEASQKANLGIPPIQIDLAAIDKTNYAGLTKMASQVRAQIEYIQSATGGIFEGSNTGEPGGEKGEDTAIKKRSDTLAQLVKKYAEIQQKIGGNVEKAQQMLEKELERIRANETINKKLSLQGRNHKSEYNLAKQRVELAKLNLSQEIKALDLSQELVKDERKRLAAQTKIKEITLEINEAQEDVNEKRHEENLTIFDTLEKIQKIRASLNFPGDSLANQFAGAGDKLMGLAYNISQTEKKYKALYTAGLDGALLFTGNMSEAIKIVKEYTDILEGVADFYQMRDDAIKKQKDKEQEINDTLKERLSIYKEIEDFLKGQADSGAKIAQDAIKRQFDIETSQNEGSFLPEPTRAAILLAQQFGANVEDVTLNIDKYIERYVELLKTPGAQFDIRILQAFKGLDSEVNKSLSSVQKFGDKVKEVSKLNRDLGDSQMKFYESQFNRLYNAKFDDKGKLKEGVTFTEEDAKRLESYASQYQSMIDKNRQNPNLVTDADEILRQLTLAASLREKIEDANEVLLTQETQKVNFIIQWLNSDIFDSIKKDAENKLKDLRATLRVNVLRVSNDIDNKDQNNSQITNLENFLRDGTLLKEAFAGAISDIIQNASRNSAVLKNQEGADDPLESQYRQSYLEKRLEGGLDIGGTTREPPKLATGGKINGPGTSTSDSILARLSNGEYVVKASAVQHYGTSFLDSVNSKSLKAFNGGGQNGDAAEGVEIRAMVKGAIATQASRKLPSPASLEMQERYKGLPSLIENELVNAANALLEPARKLESAAKDLKELKVPLAIAIKNGVASVSTDEQQKKNGKEAGKTEYTKEQVAEYASSRTAQAIIAEAGTVAKEISKTDPKAIMNKLFDSAAKFFEQTFKQGEKTLTKANEDLEDAKRGTEKAKPADLKEKRKKDGQESGIYKTLMQIGKTLQSFGAAIGKSIENILNLSFVIENIEALKTYRKRVSEIGKTFKEQIGGIEKALSRNESSYFDYLNSLQDAEEERLKSLLDAEKQYQEQLKKTSEIAQETFSNMFKGIAGFGGDQIGSAFDSLSEKMLEKGAEQLGTMPSLSDLADMLTGGSSSEGGDKVEISQADIVKAAKLASDAKDAADSAGLGVIIDSAAALLGSASPKEGPGFSERLDGALNKILGAFAPSGKTDFGPFEGLADALGSVGGWIAEAISPFTDMIGSLAGTIGDFAAGIGERVTSLVSGLVDFTPGKMIADAVASSPMLSGAASMVGGGLLAGVGALAGPLTSIIGEGISLATKNPTEFQKFIDEFIKQLPEAAKKFIDTVVEALPKIISALSEMLPVLFTTIAEALPDLIMMIANQLPILITSFLESLIAALPKIAMALIKGIVVAVPKIIAALLNALGSLLQELPNIILALVVGIIEGLFVLLTSPDFWINLGKAILKFMFFPITGFLKMFGIDVFHEGGVIPGNATDVPIIAQGGEGVLSRQGMRALGGAGALDKLNSGVNPFIEDINRYHSGGVVGEAMTRDAIINRQPSVSSSSVNTSNNISVNVTVNGSMDSRQIDQMTNKLVNEIDGKLSKKVQDRDSRLARSMANRK